MSEYPCFSCGENTHCSELDNDMICNNCRESQIEKIINTGELQQEIKQQGEKENEI